MKFLSKPIYLDVCALCRTFDDQQYLRIRLEATAVDLVIEHVRQGDYKLYYSPAHRFEIDDLKDTYEREELQDFLRTWGTDGAKHVRLRETRQRAEELVRNGFSTGDAVHSAFAEALNAHFITCDDRLLKQCKRFNVDVWTGTPIEFCQVEGLK
jgi:predicted nucleic acid-binding protein